MFKKENGITLIALVITIIILLILAGITISVALGNNGLLGRGANAANTYRHSEENEVKTLNGYSALYDNMYEDYVVTPNK